LFKSLNAPDRYTLNFEPQNLDVNFFKTNLIKLNPMNQMLFKSTIPAIHLEDISMNLCRNNRLRSGGLTGAMLLLEHYDLSITYPELRRQGNKRYDHHTFYRNVLPDTKYTKSYQKHCTFISKRLTEKKDNPDPLYIFDQLMQSNCKHFPTAFLNQLPEGRKITLNIPNHATPGFLRIIVPKPFKETSFYVKRGQMSPVLFTTRTNVTIPNSDYQTNPNEVYVRLQCNPKTRPTNMAGSSLDIPGNLINAEVFNLYLPANVKTIEAWQDQTSRGNSDIAFQYRDSKRFSWSASDFLNRASFIRMEKIQEDLLNSLPYKKNKNDSLYPDEEEFIEFLNPLYRFLQSRATRFAGSVSSKSKQLYDNSTNHQEEKNIFKQIEFFQNIGDFYASKELLKGILVYQTNTTLRKKAFKKLKSFYEQNKDNQALISLYAYAVFQHIFPNCLWEILPILLAEGYTKIAHLLCLTLEASPEVNHDRLTALFKQNWDEVIFTKLEDIVDSKQKNFWHMQMLLKNGQYNDARELFSTTQPQDYPDDYYQHIKKGFQIHNNLLKPDKDIRLNAILEWEQWQDEHPGAKEWKNANELIVDYSGAQTISILISSINCA
jgi:hypothetical protein